MTPTPDFRALCAELVKRLDELNCNFDIPSQSALIERALDLLATPLVPLNCWLDDEPELCPGPCVFDDPSEVIHNCTYAQRVKCKTDCQYYRAATPPPEPPTDEEIDNFLQERWNRIMAQERSRSEAGRGSLA